MDWSPLSGRYRVILADPPWRFKPYRAAADGAVDRSASRHYRLMSLARIKGMPVRELAAADCFLVLWGTQAQLPDAVDTVRAWGFEFKTAGAWAKQSRSGDSWAFGTGYLLRSAAEFFLVGTRGNPKPRSRRERNLLVAPIREHSRKPEAMYELLEAKFPGERRCELFARGASRPGWESWGNEAGKKSLTKP